MMSQLRSASSQRALCLLVLISISASTLSVIAARRASRVELLARQPSQSIDGFAPNSHVAFRFEIFNPTWHDVLVQHIEASCTCTDFSISSMRIAAGSKAVLSGSVSTASYSRIDSLLIVYYRSAKDARMRELRLVLKGSKGG